jgi:nucleotide-binding universal stress UspA family protein
MYTRILVPTDGSPGSEKAVRNALDVAEKYDASLYAVSVVETDGSRVPFKGSELRSKLVERAEAALEEVRREADEWDVEVTTQVLEGRPHEKILQFADQHDVDLVVMGTHGREGLDRFLIGSVTERVVRSADVPVLTVSLGGDEPAVTTETRAKEIARDALESRGYDDIDLPEGAYNERSSWVVRATAGGTTFNVHIDKVTGSPHLVEIGEA